MKAALGAAALVALIVAASQARADAPDLSFDQALGDILARSTGVATQVASLGAQVARDVPIRLSFAPSISADAKRTNSGGVIGIPSIYGSQAEVVAQANFFRWGADYKSWQAANHDEASQRALLDDSWLSAENGGAGALILFIQRRKEVDVAAGIVRMRQDSLAVAKQRYEGGYLPLQEMEKVSVDLANAEARLADAQEASAAADAALLNLLGHTRVLAEWPWKDRFSAAPAPGPVPDATALARLLAARPDWRAAQAKADAEDARLSSDWRLLGPSIDGQLNYGYYYSDFSYNVSPPGPLGGLQWQGSVSVSLPLFDRLTLYSNARAQSYVKGAAETALEQVRRDARSEWESARRSYAPALASAQVRDKTLVVSRRVYQDALQRLRSGRISADDLVLEQTRLYDSELLAVQGWASVHLAYARLCRAQGERLAACRIQ